MTRSEHDRNNLRGFTLMEMLVVLGILAMLLALVVPRIMGTQKKADISTAQSQIKLLRECLKQYYLDMKEYPSTEQGLKALIEKPADLDEDKAKRWDGPYIEGEQLPRDPWGNDYQYEFPPKHGTTGVPDIWSFGIDRENETEDDIVSWSQSQEGGDAQQGASKSSESSSPSAGGSGSGSGSSSSSGSGASPSTK